MSSKKSFDRSTFTFDKQSWHAKWYAFWRRNGKRKNTPEYVENLCHYVRVILFWAPLWFIATFPEKSDVKAWHVPAITAPFAVVSWGTFYWPETVSGLWAGAAIVAFFATLVILCFENSDRLSEIFGPYLDKMLDAGEWAWGKIRNAAIKFGKWFAFAGPRFLKPWMVAVVALAVTSGVLFPKFSLIATLVALGLATCIAVGAGLAYVVQAHDDKVEARKELDPVYAAKIEMKQAKRQAKGKKRRFANTLKLVWAYLVAKKHKICPLIAFDEGEATR